MSQTKSPLDKKIDAIFEAFRMHSSPTYDRGDSHGARGQSGMLIWKSSHAFIRAELERLLSDRGDGSVRDDPWDI